jgi:hypothetical protein
MDNRLIAVQIVGLSNTTSQLFNASPKPNEI